MRNGVGRAWALAVVLALAACKPGPLEKAGKAADRAVEKTGDALKDAAK